MSGPFFPREALDAALRWRYATKIFDPAHPIPDADFAALKESLRLAPSSYGLQPWRFLDIRTPALREELKAHSHGQAQVTDCSRYLVLAYSKNLDRAHIERYIASTARARGVEAATLASFRDHMIGTFLAGERKAEIGEWARRQSYIAMGFVLLAAAGLGVDACPLEGIDHAAYDRALGLESGPWATASAIALGYRLPADKYQALAKSRFEETEVFETR